MEKHFFAIFVIFFVIPFFLPSVGLLGCEVIFEIFNNSFASINTMADAAGNRDDIRFYMAMILIFPLFWAFWFFVFKIDRNAYFLSDAQSEGGVDKLKTKSIFSLIIFAALLWYIYFLPGGMSLSKPGKGLLLIRVAIEYRTFLGLLGGFVAVGIFACWIVVFIRCYYIFRILFLGR